MDTELIYRETIMMRKHGATYAECAAHFGVSRQRIQQIVAPDKVTRWNVLARADHHCEECGKYLPLDTGHMHHIKVEEFDFNNECNILYLCLGCHTKIHHPKKRPPKRLRTLVCEMCHKSFLAVSERRFNKKFCSRACSNKSHQRLYLERHGFWPNENRWKPLCAEIRARLEINLKETLSTREGKES